MSVQDFPEGPGLRNVIGAHYPGEIPVREIIEMAFNPAELRGPHGEWWSDATGEITSEEKKALAQYLTPKGSQKINGALRAGTARITHSTMIARLDRAIAKHKVDADKVVYRGVARQKGESPWQPGDQFTDAGYSSVTTKPWAAAGFATMRSSGRAYGRMTLDPSFTPTGGHPVVLRIHVKKGQHAAPGDTSVDEMVLPRGLAYKVTGVTPEVRQSMDNPSGYPVIVDAEISEPPIAPAVKM